MWEGSEGRGGEEEGECAVDEELVGKVPVEKWNDDDDDKREDECCSDDFNCDKWWWGGGDGLGNERERRKDDALRRRPLITSMGRGSDIDGSAKSSAYRCVCLQPEEGRIRPDRWHHIYQNNGIRPIPLVWMSERCLVEIVNKKLFLCEKLI